MPAGRAAVCGRPTATGPRSIAKPARERCRRSSSSRSVRTRWRTDLTQIRPGQFARPEPKPNARHLEPGVRVLRAVIVHLPRHHLWIYYNLEELDGSRPE